MLKKLQWIAVGLLAFYTVTGFILIPYLIKHYSTAYISEGTKGSLSIDSVDFNPFTGALVLDRVKLTGPYGLILFKCQELLLDADFDAIFRKEIRLKRLKLLGAAAQLAHFRDGTLSYTWLTQPSDSVAQEEPEVAYYYQLHVDDIVLDGTAVSLPSQHIGMEALEIVRPELTVTRAKPFGVFAPKKEEAGSEPSSWVVDLQRLHIASGKTVFQDFAIAGAAYSVQDRIDLTLSALSSAPKRPMEYDLSMRVDETGSLEGSGTLQLAPLTHQGTLALRHIPLEKGASYLARDTYMKLKSGMLSLDLNVTFAQQSDGSDLRIEGSQVIEGVNISDSRDGSPLIRFDAVRTEPVTFTLKPLALHIGEIALEGVYANAVLSETGGLNVATLLKKRAVPAVAEPAAAPAPEEKAPFSASIDRIVFRNNGADFSDKTIPMGFKTSIRELEGSVSGISSEMNGRSAIAVQAVIDGYGTMGVKGSIDAADPKHFTDMALEVRNLALDAFTPYAAKFVGRKVDGGRLYVDLGYKINDSALDARNGVEIKKIKLGESVQSEDAVSLPLDLAIALLENGEGVIDIDIPIEGNLKNPDFKYGAALWKAVVNLFTNAASAPFRFLGSLLGIEGDRLEAVDFRAGESELLPPEREKLDLLAKALKERPLLLLEVGGSYDGISDKRALQVAMADALIAQSAGGKGETGEEHPDAIASLEALNRAHLSEVELAAMREGLKAQYQEPEAFAEAYRKALHEALVTAQDVTDEALTALAGRRSERIVGYLVETRGMAAERVARRESVSGEAKGGEWVPTSLEIKTR